MREGLALWNEMHYRLFAPLTGTLLAEREAEAGRVEVGLATLDEQLAAIEQTEERWFDAEVHRVRGELLLKVRRSYVAAAESAFMRAIKIARGIVRLRPRPRQPAHERGLRPVVAGVRTRVVDVTRSVEVREVRRQR